MLPSRSPWEDLTPMVEIIPFRGIRYKQKALANLISPPYDVISPEQRAELLKLSEYNFVRIELPESYLSAKRTFESWAKGKILIRDKQPSIYVYQQEFLCASRNIKRTGFFCGVRIDERNIRTHEDTLSKPVEDRLKMLRFLETATSAVFSLFPDSQNRISNVLSKIVKEKPVVQFKDKTGISHRFWQIAEPKIIKQISNGLAKEKILIADGHHRTKVSAIYRSEMSARSKKSGGLAPYDYVFMYLCPMDDPGIVILPTHRVVQHDPDIENKISKYFNLKHWDGKSLPYLTVFFQGEFKTMELKNKKLKKQYSEDMSIIALHELVLNQVNSHDIVWTKEIAEAVKKAHGINGYAFLLNPPSINTIYKLARSRKNLPIKTTYFYPKVPAGLVMYSVKD